MRKTLFRLLFFIYKFLDFSAHASMASIKEVIKAEIADYQENMPGAADRLANALEIIIVAYYAALIKRRSDEMLSGIIL